MTTRKRVIPLRRVRYIPYNPDLNLNGNGDEPKDGVGAYARHLKDAALARDRAMAQVDANADEEWKEYATDFLLEWCRTHGEMFTDELWDHGLEEPRELRALGPVVLALQRQGFIVRTGETRPRVHGHLAYGPVWKSLIYIPP